MFKRDLVAYARFDAVRFAISSIAKEESSNVT